MKIKSFTIIELILSISLMSIIFIYISETVINIKNSSYTFDEKYNSYKKYNKIKKLVYLDFIQRNKNFDTIYNTKEKKINKVIIKTNNSLYRNIFPSVLYFVDKKNNLFRLESENEIKFPVIENKKFFFRSDKILSNVESFNVLQSKDKKNVFIYIKEKNKEEIIMEI